MHDTVDTNMIIQFGLKTLGIFAVIFAIAVLTPWIAKHVDNWIANYRKTHENSKNPEDRRLYSVRSIYELPPKKTESESTEMNKNKKKTVVSARKKHD
ncbi:MAG: hypothetical protein K2G88_10615 [Oscillospiraceae bacterium]|nr:hypothetical protein [Oscillospiraceae bacterium]